MRHRAPRVLCASGLSGHALSGLGKSSVDGGDEGDDGGVRKDGTGDGGISVVPDLPVTAVIPLIPSIYAALGRADRMNTMTKMIAQGGAGT